MTAKRRTSMELRLKRGKKIASALVVGVPLAAFGNLQPYLQTEVAFTLRYLVLFPALLIFSIYGLFVHKGVRRGNLELTAYQYRMHSFTSRAGKIKETILGLAGLVLLAFFFSYSSLGVPAWATEIFARKEYLGRYVVEDIGVGGGPVLTTVFKLQLRDPKTGEKVVLPLRRRLYEQFPAEVGESVCLRGRTWIFGTVIEGGGRGNVRCGDEDRPPSYSMP